MYVELMLLVLQRSREVPAICLGSSTAIQGQEAAGLGLQCSFFPTIEWSFQSRWVQIPPLSTWDPNNLSLEHRLTSGCFAIANQTSALAEMGDAALQHTDVGGTHGLFLLLALQAPHASSPSTRQRQGLRGLSAGWQHSLQLRTLRGPRVTPGDLPAVLPCSSGPQRSRNPQTRWSQTRCAPRRLQSPERHETMYF